MRWCFCWIWGCSLMEWRIDEFIILIETWVAIVPTSRMRAALLGLGRPCWWNTNSRERLSILAKGWRSTKLAQEQRHSLFFRTSSASKAEGIEPSPILLPSSGTEYTCLSCWIQSIRVQSRTCPSFWMRYRNKRSQLSRTDTSDCRSIWRAKGLIRCWLLPFAGACGLPSESLQILGTSKPSLAYILPSMLKTSTEQRKSTLFKRSNAQLFSTVAATINQVRRRVESMWRSSLISSGIKRQEVRSFPISNTALWQGETWNQSQWREISRRWSRWLRNIWQNSSDFHRRICTVRNT